MNARRVPVWTMCLALAACATAGGPPAVTYPDVAGAWNGMVEVEGQAIEGTLELVQTEGQLRAVFDAPSFGLRAEGEGDIDPEGQVQIVLAYDLQCPGTAEMTGTRAEDGTSLRGSIVAVDCTGEIGGTFRFRR